MSTRIQERPFVSRHHSFSGSSINSRRSSGMLSCRQSSATTSAYNRGISSRNNNNRTSFVYNASRYSSVLPSTEYRTPMMTKRSSLCRSSSFHASTSYDRFRDNFSSIRNSIIDDINRNANASHDNFEHRSEKCRVTSKNLERALSMRERRVDDEERQLKAERKKREKARVISGSQSQWQEFLDQGVLIARAAEAIRRNGFRGLNKASFLFRYSTDGPSTPIPYDMHKTDTKLVRMP